MKESWQSTQKPLGILQMGRFAHLSMVVNIIKANEAWVCFM